MSHVARLPALLLASVAWLLSSAAGAQAPPGDPAAPAGPAVAPALAPVDQAPSRKPAAGDASTALAAGGETPAPGDATLKAQVDELRAELERVKEDQEVDRAAQASSSAAADPDSYAQKLALYGFMDMGLQKFFANDLEHGLYRNLSGSASNTFAIGNINLYIDAQPADGWRALVELRFTNYPNGNQNAVGTPLGGTYDRTSTNVFDVNGSNGGWSTVKWGGTVLERAYIQWTGADWFTIRAGQFLTPYGIWNVDHGTPTLIALMQPSIIISEFFPRSQVGVEMLGTTRSGAWDLGYHAYVSNGRTPTEQDYTEDKMVGGRVFARTLHPARFTVGMSGFRGRNTDIERTITSFSPYTISQPTKLAYDEFGLAGDVSLDVGRLRLRTEFALNRTDYDQGLRPRVFGQPGIFASSKTRWGSYLLAAYQLPVAGLEPYVIVDFAREPLPLSEARAVYSAGLNIHFTPATQLKAQYSRMHFLDLKGNADHSVNDGHNLAARLVVAF